MAYLEGTPELTAALRSLPAKVEKKALRSSAASGARVVRDTVKQFAPISSLIKKRGGKLIPPGTIRRAVLIKYAKERSGPDKATYIITLRRGKSQQKSNRDAFYWTWVEKGHRVVGRSGRVIGQAPPHPFFVPAFRASQGKALQVTKDTLTTQVTEIFKGLNSGAA